MGGDSVITPKRRDFTNAKSNAKRRGIPWRLTFDEWARVWVASGFYNLRGRQRGQYQMDRIDPMKGYEQENVQIISGAVNRIKDSPHGHVAKLDERSVRIIRERYKPRIVTARSLAEHFGVSVPCIKAVVSGRNWASI